MTTEEKNIAEETPLRVESPTADYGRRRLVELARDVRRGLCSSPKFLLPKYFYDNEGSRLFELICDLSEYYLMRTETLILEQNAVNLISRYKPKVLFEIGSGSARNTKILLDAMKDLGTLRGIGLMDVNPDVIDECTTAFSKIYSDVGVEGAVGDFMKPFKVPFDGISPKLVIFLSSTIGNLNDRETVSLLSHLAGQMAPDDLFLLATDLVKDEQILNDAYNDSEGITAKFNLNILRMLNRQLGADFDISLFAHRAIYNSRKQRIEMYLESLEKQTVYLEALRMNATFDKGESILTEISRKFTRESVETMTSKSKFEMLEWLTDPQEMFALSLYRPATVRRPISRSSNFGK